MARARIPASRPRDPVGVTLLGPNVARSLAAFPKAYKPRKPLAHTRTLLVAHAPMLLVTFEYDQALMKGPPFSVREAEVREIYAPSAMRLLEERPDARRPELGGLDRSWAITL